MRTPTSVRRLSVRPLASLLAAGALFACASPAPPPAPSAVSVRPLAFTDMEGRAHTVAESLDAGQKVVFVFWATWCSSCKAEMGSLAAAAREHPELDFYGVVSGPDDAVDDGRVLEVVNRWFVPYPQVRDRDLELTETFGVVGTPTIVVVDEDGRVVYRDHEQPDWEAL